MRQWIKKIALGVFILSILTCLTAAVWVQVTLKQIENGKYGTFKDIEFLNPVSKGPLQTKVYSSDGKVLASYFSDNRIHVPFDSLSTELVQCVIASEDPEHFSSCRQSPFSNCFEKAYKSLMGQHGRGLSWELSWPYRSLNQLKRNHIEFNAPPSIGFYQSAVWMSMLEKHYTKEEIVAIRLNWEEFGNSLDGVYAVSQSYFGKSPSQLNWQESACIVGMLESLQNAPRRSPEKSKEARASIFQKLFDQGVLSKTELDSLSVLDLTLKPDIH